VTRPVIVAGTLAYREDESMIAQAHDSARCLDGCFVFGEGERIDNEYAEANVRQLGIERARAYGADWYLQLDADETLLRGELLHDLLADWPHRAWALPYMQETGYASLAPCKLVRLEPRCSMLLASDVYTWADRPHGLLLSGYTCPEDFYPLLPHVPVLLHRPSARPDAADRRRLSDAIEGTARHGRSGLEQWPLPDPFHPRARAHVAGPR
jgi:hypothetical protein